MSFDPTAELLPSLPGLEPYRRSIVAHEGQVYFLARSPRGKALGLLTPPGAELPPHFAAERPHFAGEYSEVDGARLGLFDLSHQNAGALRDALPWLRPQPLGLRMSAGCGDRLGLATPGHVRAARAVPGFAMIFAQQSIREMARTGRTPAEVMDDATWGAFQEGWRDGLGADADHLKTIEDIDRCVAAGFTFYTIDPGQHVDGDADADAANLLRAKYDALPWETLETGPRDMARRYADGGPVTLDALAVALDEEAVARCAVKYGRAIAHTAAMFRHLEGVMAGRPFELEVSVDETETPTTHGQHFFIANELKRLGVRWISLAPRYVGRFEKGVDYIPSTGNRVPYGGCADLAEFEQDFAGHAEIARALGPYKLSLHSGSDKFSIYAIAARHARGAIHLKTAGASYLEALRAVSGFDSGLFREILAFAITRYPDDRASYHVSADLRNVPDPESVPEGALPALLDDFDARQVLHVTFGSVLTSDQDFKSRLYEGLEAHEEAHYAALESHFIRHLRPLMAGRRVA